MIECNEDGHTNTFPRGTYNNPLNWGEPIPADFDGRYVYWRPDGSGEVMKFPNPNY